MMNFKSRHRTVIPVVLVLLWVTLTGTKAQAGGIDYNHYWNIKLGNCWFVVSEIKGYTGKRKPFTRVQFGKTAQLHGRDFQCGIWTFTAVVSAMPILGFVGLYSLVQYRRRNRPDYE